MLTPLIISFALFIQFPIQISPHTPLFTPITKDDSTKLYTISIYLKTPLQPSSLHLDLGFYLPYYDCSRHYKSTSYSPVPFNSTLCNDIDPKASSNCFNKPSPGCSLDGCAYFPENPVTGKGGIGQILTDKFALRTLKDPVRPGPVSEIVLSCTYPDRFSKNYRGLAKGSVGLATLGRFNYSLSAQISRESSSPWIFALCLPSSSEASGIALFNSIGPYVFSPRIDGAALLIYTPLILGPRGIDTKIFNWYESPDYYIGVTSFRVNGKSVPLNRTLLNVDENGFGGTRLSTSRPYTVLQSTIYNALMEAFVRESKHLNFTEVPAVKPFGVCYAADGIPMTKLGPAVPTVDVVMQNVFWRIYGANSMVRIGDVWCLGFVDGGVERESSAVVIGAHQFEDNVVQFDLERQRLGFSSSLLLWNTTCANFDFKSSSITNN